MELWPWNKQTWLNITIPSKNNILIECAKGLKNVQKGCKLISFPLIPTQCVKVSMLLNDIGRFLQNLPNTRVAATDLSNEKHWFSLHSDGTWVALLVCICINTRVTNVYYIFIIYLLRPLKKMRFPSFSFLNACAIFIQVLFYMHIITSHWQAF